MKAKLISHAHEVTDFYDKESPKVDSNHTCLAVISLGSVLNKNGNYCRRVFLKECKYLKDLYIIIHIVDDLESIH